MEHTTTGESHSADESGAGEVLYSAEMRQTKGRCVLTVNDHLQGSVEMYVVPEKAAQKLPFYLSMLRGKLG
ncbi:hypothetical protein ACIOKD_10785 [Streptomyces sp. NPDC087844]|uniref:hypothetical protein n=1 Tax=Streptomyces sp. NPDC087844 TaxID=3365805 RepID=UPI0038060C94